MRNNKTSMSQEERTNILPIKHTTFVLQRLNEQRIKGLFCDVSLHVDGKKFRAHRSILAANSDFFLNLFRAAEDQTNFVLAGVPVRGFSVLLDFCYTNSFTLEPSNVTEVYRAASVLNFSHISSACEKVLTSMRPKLESLNTLSSLASLGPLLGFSSLSNLVQNNIQLDNRNGQADSPNINKNKSPDSRLKSPKSALLAAAVAQARKTPNMEQSSVNGDSNNEDEEQSTVPTINAYMVFSHHMRLKSLQDQSKESPIILERSISRQWSSLGLEERRPFYEEAERIREALQQSHLPQQLQNFNNRVNGLATESSEASEEPAEKRARLSLENEPTNECNNEDEAHVSPGSPPEVSKSPPLESPEKTGPLSPISSNSQSPQTSQRRKKIAPARRLPESSCTNGAKVEVKVEM